MSPALAFGIRIFLLLPLAFSGVLALAQGTTAETDRDQPRQREQWFMHGRLIPGESAAALRYRAHAQKMQLRAEQAARMNTAITAATTTAIGIWTPLGPAPLASDATGFGQQDYGWVSGRATAVAVDPADATGNTVYIGGAYGGVWKSTNAGPLSANPANVSWSPLIDNQATLAVGSIAVQPGNTDPTKSVILVGTGETNSSMYSYYGLGILRSADAGNTWTLITQDSSGTHPFAGMGFSKIAFSTANPSLVVAAAAGASQGVIDGLENPVSANRGSYDSKNGGVSWSDASINDVGTVIQPNSATSVIYNAVAGKFFAAIRFHGFYSSSDGVNWTRLATQPGGLSTFACPTSPASQGCPIYRGEFSVVPGRNEMYVWYVDENENDQGIRQTTDGGNTWTQLDDSGITNCGDYSGGCGTAQGSYNLELAAVPNGLTATDLYAGAINIYKCTISSLSPVCSGTGQGTFLNLTHVYGCAPNFGSIAHVHPDQHDLDFMIANSKAILYFANDGGIYRALDGYSGLTTGDCSGTNQFDSLNQTLGSMSQFVSFSQHPSDLNTILGGTQDNGSPATTSSATSTSWFNVNSGDGGYTAINPDNPAEWFTANTNVSIQKCELAGNCHAQDFSNGLVVSNATVGGDSGAFYTPYILDPQNSGTLIVGTCRVWRGATSGTGFSVLSNNFETGGDGICGGNEVNLVRSLAAGGIKDTSGFSNVMYVGTDGLGPLAPTGGHVWVSTNVDSAAWFDRTGAINPGKFPISGAAIDPSDKTGKTAYVAIMGFHVAHVWKTSNGGVNWTNFTANLPDAPVNAILIDAGSTPSTGTIYVGTDVGVFSSSTGTATWTEVGPGGQAGFLPNVSVTALHMFNAGGNKILRASTYGRGVWQSALTASPDFEFSVASDSATVFPGQTAVLSGTVLAINGYNSPVNLSCSAGATPPPAACAMTPSSVTPTATFSVNANGPVGDYFFNAHGVGTDAKSLTRNLALTLHVVDFGLTAPAPSSVTVAPGNTSGPVRFLVTAVGAFNSAVSLACSGLPAGAACSFQPAGLVNPVSGVPVAVTMALNTSAITPTGSFPISIVGSTAVGPSRSQNLSLVVNTATSADYTINISNSPQTAGVTGNATFNGTLISVNGYSSSVTLSCGSGGPVTCTPAPGSVTPTAGGAAFTVSVRSDVVQNYNFNIVATGSDSGHITHSAGVVFNPTFDFAINNNSAPETVTAGQTASYNLDVRPLGNASTFPASVTLACFGLPALSTCSFTPSSVGSGSGDTNVVVNVRTTATIPASAQARGGLLKYALAVSLVLLGFGGMKRAPRGKLLGVLFVVLMVVGLENGCGGGSSGGGGGGGAGQPGTPTGNYTIVVTATSGALSHSVQVNLTVN